MIFSVSLPWRGGWGGSITAILLWLCLTLQLLAVITTISAERIQPYDVLGIHRRATNQEIRKAYKSKVKQWHPDKNEQAKLYIPSTISTAQKSHFGHIKYGVVSGRLACLSSNPQMNNP